MKLFFTINVHPFQNRIDFEIKKGDDVTIISEKYSDANDDWGSFIFQDVQYDWNISHHYGMNYQDLVKLYEVKKDDGYRVDYNKTLKNKWIKTFI